ncbi:MAG TPA: hypothetical protein PKW90_16440 [Myxococcota bacterium]|nr:hypothetical protein [Myxococcota bacterium]
MPPPLPEPAPHVIVAASAGLPDLVGAHVEVFLPDKWSIEVGAGIGLLPLTIHAGARWAPLCLGCWNGHAFRLSTGAMAFVFPSDLKEGMAVIDVEAAWIWYKNGGPGVTMAARAGLGPAWGPSSSGLKIEPALELIPIQVGMVF